MATALFSSNDTDWSHYSWAEEAFHTDKMDQPDDRFEIGQIHWPCKIIILHVISKNQSATQIWPSQVSRKKDFRHFVCVIRNLLSHNQQLGSCFFGFSYLEIRCLCRLVRTIWQNNCNDIILTTNQTNTLIYLWVLQCCNTHLKVYFVATTEQILSFLYEKFSEKFWEQFHFFVSILICESYYTVPQEGQQLNRKVRYQCAVVVLKP